MKKKRLKTKAWVDETLFYVEVFVVGFSLITAFLYVLTNY